MSCESHHHSSNHHHDDPNRGSENSLLECIDIENASCLNESINGSIKGIFKPWNERFDVSKLVTSEADEQLIIRIPFTASVKLKSIQIIGGPGRQSPLGVKVYSNRDYVDFDTCDSITCDQELNFAQQTGQLDLEYPVKIARFSQLENLTLFVSSNHGADDTIISYIGLKGEFLKFTREPVITTYEAAANPADHKTRTDSFLNNTSFC